jgi:hypothetical protein
MSLIGGAQELSDFAFALAGENVVEAGVDGWRQGVVVPRPELGNTGATSLLGHEKDVVGFLEIEGKPHSVPAAEEVFGIRPEGILRDGEAGQILFEKTRAKRDSAGMPKRQRELQGACSRK